jgi:hypothetical protein
MGEPIMERKVRSASLRRRRVTTLTGFAAGDRLVAAWDVEKREWRLVVESANGLRIDHSHLTNAGTSA